MYEYAAGYRREPEGLSEEIYQAVKTGIEDLDTLLGADYAARDGGLAVDFPY